MTPFSLLLASLLAAIIMFGGSVLIAMVLLERPLRKKLAEALRGPSAVTTLRPATAHATPNAQEDSPCGGRSQQSWN